MTNIPRITMKNPKESDALYAATALVSQPIAKIDESFSTSTIPSVYTNH